MEIRNTTLVSIDWLSQSVVNHIGWKKNLSHSVVNQIDK